MLTALIYTTHLCLLMAGFYVAGRRPVLFILALAMAVSWVAGAMLHGPERTAFYIVLDLFVIFAVKVWRDRARDRMVAFVSLASIIWAVSYVSLSYINYTAYASGVNCAQAMQLLIGGGMVDDLGRRTYDWLHSVWPRAARVLRTVAV